MTVETPYERRVKRVRDVVREYSELDGDASSELAKHILRSLDTIPEKVR